MARKARCGDWQDCSGKRERWQAVSDPNRHMAALRRITVGIANSRSMDGLNPSQDHGEPKREQNGHQPRGSCMSGEETEPPADPASLASRLRRVLASHHLIWLAPLLAVLLCHQALDYGLQIDDHAHRVALQGVDGFEGVERPFWRLFAFADDSLDTDLAVEMGSWPWWTSEELRLAFLRPVSGFSHWLDYRLWPDSPWAMHVHSLLWLALVVAMVGILYRQLETTPWVAGLATLLFAVDEAHAVPAAWIANRNALLAAFFGCLSLWAHHRWRQGWRPGVVVSCGALLLAVGSNEGAVAVGAYLSAYALCLESGPWRRRGLSLLPAASLGIGWWMIYKLLGYGTRGSAVYIDPGHDPGRFLSALIERAPWLLLGQWTPFPADLPTLMSADARRFGWLLAVLICGLLSVLLWGLWQRDRLARFWAFGMALSIVPVCATFPSNRLLLFVGVGAMGLLARAWLDVRRRLASSPRGERRGRWHRRVMAGWLSMHLLLAPCLLWAAVGQQRAFFEIFDRAVASLPSDQDLQGQELVLVNAPSAFVVGYGFLTWATQGHAMPSRIRLLVASIHSVEVQRPDEHSLIVRPTGGLLLPPGDGSHLGLDLAPFDNRYFFQLLDLLFRDHEPPFRLGERVRLGGLDIEVIEVTDGRAAAMRFRFASPLEEVTRRWMSWQGDRFVPFELPAVGQEIIVPAVAPLQARSAE